MPQYAYIPGESESKKEIVTLRVEFKTFKKQSFLIYFIFFVILVGVAYLRRSELEVPLKELVQYVKTIVGGISWPTP